MTAKWSQNALEATVQVSLPGSNISSLSEPVDHCPINFQRPKALLLPFHFPAQNLQFSKAYAQIQFLRWHYKVAPTRVPPLSNKASYPSHYLQNADWPPDCPPTPNPCAAFCAHIPLPTVLLIPHGNSACAGDQVQAQSHPLLEAFLGDATPMFRDPLLSCESLAPSTCWSKPGIDFYSL